MSTVEIIAHRGASYDAPENTLTSVQLGWKQQADGVEIDIKLSKDGHIVAFHDFNTARTTGLNRSLAELTLAELRDMDAGSWKDARFVGERIPTLEEILATIPAGKRLFIEIKAGTDIVPELKRCIERSGKTEDQLVLMCFSPDTLAVAKAALPRIATYWLIEAKYFVAAREPVPSLDELIQQTRDAGFDGLSFDFNWPVDTKLIQKVKESDLKCYLWTIDNPEDARWLIEAGIDGITSNRPLWLREKLDK